MTIPCTGGHAHVRAYLTEPHDPKQAAALHEENAVELVDVLAKMDERLARQDEILAQLAALMAACHHEAAAAHQTAAVALTRFAEVALSVDRFVTVAEQLLERIGDHREVLSHLCVSKTARRHMRQEYREEAPMPQMLTRRKRSRGKLIKNQ